MKTSTILSLSALSAVAVCQASIYSQCGGQGWTGPITCPSGSTCVSHNEWYSQCIAGGDSEDTEPAPEPSAPQVSSAESTTAPSSAEEAPVPSVTEAVTATASDEEEATTEVSASAPSTTLATQTKEAIAAPSGVTKTLPQSSGTVETDAAIPVSGEFDGGMKLYDRVPAVCQEQTETGEDDAMFILEDGATLSNVILGPGQAEGVHCKGSCTLINVWHSDVCEDAITLKQTSGTSNIIGGGAFKASDKVVQFNGRGTVSIKDFYVEDFGKLVRNCGNCKDNGGPRNIVIENVVAVDGGVLCGINTNYEDTCAIANSCHSDGKSCDRYEGNSSGAEPTKIGSGPDGEFCTVTGLTETC